MKTFYKNIRTFHSGILLYSVILISIFILFSNLTNTYTCQSDDLIHNYSNTRARTSTYSQYNLHKIHGGSLAGGSDHGNFDDDSYHELVVVGGSSQGRVTLIDYNEGTSEFDNHLVWWDPNGGLVEAAVGELNNSHDGPEIIVGGYSGHLVMINYINKTSITNETIWRTSKQVNDTSKLNHIFGIAIGDLDSRSKGNEIVVVDASTNFLYILIKNGSIWEESKVPLYDLPRNVFVGDFDSSHFGSEVLVTCVNGTVYSVSQNLNNWETVEIFKDSTAPMSAVIDDFNTSHPGDEIIIAGLSKKATLIWGSGTSWYNQIIWDAPGALEGIGFGEFDKLHEGNELCIAGYSNTAVMLYENKTGWYNEIIYFDPNPLQTELNGVIITDFYPLNKGTELIVIGFTGNVTMLIFETPDFKFSTPSDSKTITAGDWTTYQVSLETMSGYSSKVKLSVSGLKKSDDLAFDFSHQILSPEPIDGQNAKSAVLTVVTSTNTTPKTYEFSVVGTGMDDDRIRVINLTLIVNPQEKKPDFKIEITPKKVLLNLSKDEYSVKVQVKILPVNQFNETVKINISESFLSRPEVDESIRIQIFPDSINPEEISIIDIVIFASVKSTVKYSIPIYVKNSKLNIEHDTTFILETVYFEDKTEDGSGDSSDIQIEQIVSLVLLLTVIIILLSFIGKRAHDLKLKDQQLLEKRRQEQKRKKRSR